MSAQAHATVTFERYGGEMNICDTGTRKSPPLIGDEIEWRRYACPDCGVITTRKRKPGADWEPSD